MYCYVIKYQAKQKHLLAYPSQRTNSKKLINKESNDKLKEINVKNRVCYYFDGIIEVENFDSDDIIFDENSRENIFFYDISKKTLIHAKPSCIRFDKVDGFIRLYDGTRYLITIWR